MNIAASDALLTIAEIAIAFAGFSSIVAIFGQRATAPWNRANLFRLEMMILTSLAALLLALLPLCLSLLGFSEQATWVIASGVFGALMAATGLFSQVRVRNLRTTEETSPIAPISRGVALVMLLVTVLIVALQICNTFDIVVARGAGPYVSGLVLLLAMSAVQFVRLLFLGIAVPE